MNNLKSPLILVFCIVFVDVLGIGILIPVIPLLLTDPLYPYHLGGITIDQGYVLLGWLTAIYPLMQFLATPILGQLGDHYGRRPVLAFSLAGTALSYVVFAIGIMLQNIPLLFISRAIDGITGGNISVAQAAIADSTPPEKRARAFGIIGAAFGIGFIAGPFLGGKLSDPTLIPWFNATTPFWFAAILALLNTLGVIFIFRETLVTKSKEAFRFTQALINIKIAALAPRMRALFGVSFLFQAGFAFFTSFFGAYMISRFNFTQGNIGDYFAFIGIWIALTQIFVTGFAAKRFNTYAILSFSLAGVALTLFGFALASESWMLYLIGIPQAVCMGLIMANLTGLISRSAPREEQGKILGIASSVQAVAQSIPPVLAGYIAASLAPSTPLLVGAVSVAFGWLLFVVVGKKLTAAANAEVLPSTTH